MKTILEHRTGAIQVGRERGRRRQQIHSSILYLGNSEQFHIQIHETVNRSESYSSSGVKYVQESHLPPEFRNRFPLLTTGYLSASLLSGQISPSAANTTL